CTSQLQVPRHLKTESEITRSRLSPSRELTEHLPNQWPEDMLLRKEVIQPQVPLRLPCYDFTPVIDHSLGTCLPCGLAQPLLDQSTPMVWRAVCTRPGNVFTAAC